MARPARADRCSAEITVKHVLYTCQRKKGHDGAHSEGATRWEEARL